MFNNDKISSWLYFVPIIVLFTGIFNTLNNWCNRKKKYKRLALRNIAKSSTTAGTKLFSGLIGYTQGGLILGTIIGQIAATCVLSFQVWKEDKNILLKTNKAFILNNLKEYSNFPKYTAWHGFFDLFNVSATIFIISAFFGSSILGLYSFTISLLQKPLKLIGSSIAQVYYQKASEVYNEGKSIWKITKKIILRLSFIGILIFLPIAFGGPYLFSIIFGNEWNEAGVIAQILLPWLFVRFIGSPITSSINILGKQKNFFWVTLGYNILFPTTIFLGYKMNFEFNRTLLIVSLISAIYLLGIIHWIRLKIRNES